MLRLLNDSELILCGGSLVSHVQKAIISDNKGRVYYTVHTTQYCLGAQKNFQLQINCLYTCAIAPMNKASPHYIMKYDHF